MLVPPSALIVAIWAAIAALAEAEVMGTTQCGRESKATSPTKSLGPSSSTVAMAADLQISTFWPCIEPERSSTKARAVA